MRLPDPLKTIQSKDVGGLAGGTKFVRGHILCKLPQDPLLKSGSYLFGGSGSSLRLAHKSAGRELTAFDALSMELMGDESKAPVLTTPMCCLVDYRGHRVFAVAMLPVSKATLVLGSADGGETVVNRDLELEEAMRNVAEALHLAAHQVLSHFESVEIAQCAQGK